MADEDAGVLGKLPRSRPGTRSQKRVGGGAPKRGARQAPAPASPMPDGDPMADAVKLVAQVPLVGVRFAAGVTRELMRRLPRP